MVGLKYLVEDRATWTARILWTITYGITIWMVCTYISMIYSEYTHTPITTMPDSDYFPTEYMEFPGVAICSVNRISKRKADTLANNIYNSKITNFTFNELLSSIRELGHMYDNRFERDDYAIVTDILTQYYGKRYDMTQIMRYLTPECSDLLISCTFHGIEKNCMEYFEVRKTQDGFCCVFNYFPLSDYELQEDNHRKVKLVEHLSLKFGLSVVLNPMLDDQFFSILPITGFKVLIFRPYDYPDVTSGGISEFLVEPLTQKYVKLQAVGQRSSDAIRSYPLNSRKCIFKDERRTIHESYSKSNCILACKMEDIWRFCKCKPFFYPQPSFKQDEQSFDRTCTMEDATCLRRYADQKRYVIPYFDRAVMGLVKRNQMLLCNECYPECNDVTYEASNDINSFKPSHYINEEFENVTDYTMLYVYFSHGNTVFLRQGQSYEWYDYLSDIGGICGFFLGCSIVSVVEIIYYFFLFLMELLVPQSESKTQSEAESPRKQLPIQTLYLNELVPRSRFA